MKTIVVGLKHQLTVKQLIACLLILLGAPGKKAQEATPPPLILRCPPWGVWIFSGTTQLVQRKIDR